MTSCKLQHVLTVREVAHMWNVSVKTVRYYLDRGYIRFRETENGHKLIHRASATAYLGEPVNKLDIVVYRAINQTGLVDTGSMGPRAKVGVGDLQQVVNELNLAGGGAGVGEYEFDVLTQTTTISERFAALLGSSLAEMGQRLPARVWFDWVHPDDLPGVRAALGEFLAGGGVGFNEYEARLGGAGAWRWLLFRAVVVDRDTHGCPLRMVGIALDVTERKKAALS